MIAIDIAAVLIVAALIGLAVWSRTTRFAIKSQNKPAADLARAARIIDRILVADAVIPSIPADLLNEAQTFVHTYYREIETS